MKSKLPPLVHEDYQAWELFNHKPYRWVFNKLEVATRQGLHAGPAGTAPKHDGLYISRPIYNLYGMGINAEQFHYESEMERSLLNHDKVKPGHFWCEWLQGEQYSIDYQQYEDGSWKVNSVWQGAHYSHSNLTKFKSWTKLSPRATPHPSELPLELEFLDTFEVPFFNVEMIGEHIIEIHLRPGDLRFDHLPVGTSLYPVWQGEDTPPGTWLEEPDPEMTESLASGHLKDARDGFIIVEYPHQF